MRARPTSSDSLRSTRALARLAPLWLACFLCACPKHTPTVKATGDGARPDAAPSVVVPSASAASNAPDSGVVDASAARPLPPAFAVLGGRCPADAGADDRTLFCDAQARVSGVWAMVDTVDDVPPHGIEVIREEPRREMAPGRSLVVALEGERLWFRLVTCGACRRVMGWAFVGDLPLLTDEQLGIVQERLGLPKQPALRTAAAWRDVYRNRPLPPSPDAAVPFDKMP